MRVLPHQHAEVERGANDNARLAGGSRKLAFDQADEPVVRGAFAAVGEVGEPFSKLVKCVHHAIAGKPGATFGFEPAFAHDLGDGPVRCTIVVKLFAHDPRQPVEVALRDHSDAAVHGGRTQIDQQTVGLKDTVSFAEGMDHALVGHSSQGPGKDHGIETSVAVAEPFGVGGLKTDTLCEPLWKRLAGFTNKRGIRVDRMHDGSQFREPPREPPVAAADLKDSFAVPVRNAVQRPNFILFRVNA